MERPGDTSTNREIELSNKKLRICLVNANKTVKQDIYNILYQHTDPIAPNGLEIIQDLDQSDLLILTDIRTDELPKYIDGYKKIILLTVQPRKHLDQYLAGCRSVCKENWNKIKVVKIDVNKEEDFVQKWWELHLAVFSEAQTKQS